MIKIEAGKYYVTADGVKVGPMRRWTEDKNGKHCWEEPTETRFNKYGDIWKSDGTCAYDDTPALVREFTDEKHNYLNVEVLFDNGVTVRHSEKAKAGTLEENRKELQPILDFIKNWYGDSGKQSGGQIAFGDYRVDLKKTCYVKMSVDEFRIL